MASRFEQLTHHTAEGLSPVPLYLNEVDDIPSESIAMLRSAEIIVAALGTEGVAGLRDKVGGLLADEMPANRGILVEDEETADVVRIEKETTTVTQGRGYSRSLETGLFFDMLHVWAQQIADSVAEHNGRMLGKMSVGLEELNRNKPVVDVPNRTPSNAGDVHVSHDA